jgi:hypothetical protein
MTLILSIVGSRWAVVGREAPSVQGAGARPSSSREASITKFQSHPNAQLPRSDFNKEFESIRPNSTEFDQKILLISGKIHGTTNECECIRANPSESESFRPDIKLNAEWNWGRGSKTGRAGTSTREVQPRQARSNQVKAVKPLNPNGSKPVKAIPRAHETLISVNSRRFYRLSSPDFITKLTHDENSCIQV